MAGAGVLRLQQIFPFTIGANIGTTVTGLIAALAAASAMDASVDAEKNKMVEGATVAFAHLLFNCAGAIIFLPFARIRELPIKFAEALAELCLKNRAIPIVIIVGVFYLIPIVVTWSTISGALSRENPPGEQTVPDGNATDGNATDGKGTDSGD